MVVVKDVEFKGRPASIDAWNHAILIKSVQTHHVKQRLEFIVNAVSDLLTQFANQFQKDLLSNVIQSAGNIKEKRN